jgi:hypothetical protein
VVVLKVWHEHTFEEIGQLLGVSPNTAAGRYRYGLEKLRVCLKGQEYESTEPNGRGVRFPDSASAHGLRSHERSYGSAAACMDASPTLAES